MDNLVTFVCRTSLLWGRHQLQRTNIESCKNPFNFAAFSIFPLFVAVHSACILCGVLRLKSRIRALVFAVGFLRRLKQ